MKGEKNHMYGKKGHMCPIYGIRRTEEQKRKLSESKKDLKIPCMV